MMQALSRNQSTYCAKSDSANLFIGLLQRPPINAKQALIVVIALSKFQEEEQCIRTILRVVSRLEDIVGTHFQVFLTSRPDLPIRVGFEKLKSNAYQDVAFQMPSQDLATSVLENSEILEYSKVVSVRCESMVRDCAKDLHTVILQLAHIVEQQHSFDDWEIVHSTKMSTNPATKNARKPGFRI
jgi:hypothetical protein